MGLKALKRKMGEVCLTAVWGDGLGEAMDLRASREASRSTPVSLPHPLTHTPHSGPPLDSPTLAHWQK